MHWEAPKTDFRAAFDRSKYQLIKDKSQIPMTEYILNPTFQC